jgi:hypothetical protein
VTCDGKKPGVAPFWATVVVVVLPLFYVLSFGPAFWITHRCKLGVDAFNASFWPLGWVARQDQNCAFPVICRYARLGIRDGDSAAIPTSPNSIHIVPPPISRQSLQRLHGMTLIPSIDGSDPPRITPIFPCPPRRTTFRSLFHL